MSEPYPSGDAEADQYGNVDEIDNDDSNIIEDTNAPTMKYPKDSGWDDFGSDVCAIHEVLSIQSSNIADEQSQIKALVDRVAMSRS